MSPNRITAPLVREAPVLRVDTTVGEAVRLVFESDFPALPVLDDEGCLAGIFGEREFLEALFPGYVGELRFAGFVRSSLDEALEKRVSCRMEPIAEHMTTEEVDVPPDASDIQVAETFIHHRVLILPVVDEDRRLRGVITRNEFARQLAARLLER